MPSSSRSGRGFHARSSCRQWGKPARELAAVDDMEAALNGDIMRAQARLDAAHDARNGFGVLAIAIPLAAILAGLLVLLARKPDRRYR
jgi:hypothetical protein